MNENEQDAWMELMSTLMVDHNDNIPVNKNTILNVKVEIKVNTTLQPNVKIELNKQLDYMWHMQYKICHVHIYKYYKDHQFIMCVLTTQLLTSQHQLKIKLKTYKMNVKYFMNWTFLPK